MVRRVVVTGIGVVSPNGIGREAFWTATRNGVSGVKRITQFDPSPWAVHVAGHVAEFQEELHVTPHAPRKLGELQFSMSDCPDILCHVYRADDFSGTPTETEEAVPVWSALDAIPYHRMWEDDQHWLPLLLTEQSFRGRFVFEADHLRWSEVTTDVVW